MLAMWVKVRVKLGRPPASIFLSEGRSRSMLSAPSTTSRGVCLLMRAGQGQQNVYYLNKVYRDAGGGGSQPRRAALRRTPPPTLSTVRPKQRDTDRFSSSRLVSEQSGAPSA